MVVYAGKPYSNWVKCIHTCPHTSEPNASRRDQSFSGIRYTRGDEELIAGNIIPIFPRTESHILSHAVRPAAHGRCDNKCLGNNFLGKGRGVRMRDVRVALTEEDWQEYGVAMAILQAKNKHSKDIPSDYFEEAHPYLKAQLSITEYEEVLQRRGISAAADQAVGTSADPGRGSRSPFDSDTESANSHGTFKHQKHYVPSALQRVGVIVNFDVVSKRFL